MNKKTQRILLRITQETARICGISKEMEQKPDPKQLENKDQAREILARTKMPNQWSFAKNIQIAQQMQAVLDEPVRMVINVSEEKASQYDRILTMKINKAIRNGEIPDPRKDKELQAMLKKTQNV